MAWQLVAQQRERGCHIVDMPWIWPDITSVWLGVDPRFWTHQLGLGWDDKLCIACIVMYVTVVRADIH